MKTRPSKNSGFSLLEILISLVIMSVGMMGLAGLKMVAIKGTNEAHFRHEASILMADLADRMRANRVAVDAGNYQATSAVSLTTQPTICEGSTACTSSQLATYDKYQIALRMSQSMPGSSLTITCPGTTCNTVNDVKLEHTIVISWKEKKFKSENMTTEVGGVVTTNESNNRSITIAIVP